MKKFLRTGKKTLSVFLAVLMAFTALVFAAPQKASAVNAGKYYVRVTCYNDNAKDAKGRTQPAAIPSTAITVMQRTPTEKQAIIPAAAIQFSLTKPTEPKAM